MFVLPTDFEPYLAVWQSLPRRTHPLLPCKHDVTPAAFGAFLPFMALTEMRGFHNLHISFVGTTFEHNAGLKVSGRNYYDLLPTSFHRPMEIFHHNMLGTPCGAYVCDLIVTTSGKEYTHETLQLPLADDEGDVRYLMAYGLARTPYGDAGGRADESHRPSNIKEQYYIDLGAGAPVAHVQNFKYHREQSA